MTWKAPKSDGGALITGYVVERREGSRTTWTKIGQTSSETLKYKATRLTEGTEYAFRVAAENAIGVGEFATIDKPVKADVPFGQPASTFCLFLISLTTAAQTNCCVLAPKSGIKTIAHKETHKGTHKAVE